MRLQMVASFSLSVVAGRGTESFHYAISARIQARHSAFIGMLERLAFDCLRSARIDGHVEAKRAFAKTSVKPLS